MKTFSINSLMLAVGCAFASAAHATTTCTMSITNPTINTIVALQGGSITVGPDIPNGTILFRQYFKVGTRPTVDCSSTTTPWHYWDSFIYTNNPKPLAAWNSGNWAGKVFQTGIPGIGIAAWYSGNAVPVSKASSAVSTAKLNINTVPEFDISLIKIGPVTPGTLRGQDLPTVADNLMTDGGTSIRVSTVAFSGTLNIVSQTCITPNPVVQLGKYDIASTFKGVGSFTGWANANINLTNCPRFYGTMNDGQNNYGSDSPTDRGKAGTPQPNTLGVSLKPNTAIVDAAKGIMGLKMEPDVATGVGIQLATAVAGAGGTPAVFNTEKSYTMTNSASTTYTIPLFARYYQTDAKVTPGPANATMTYTINYY